MNRVSPVETGGFDPSHMLDVVAVLKVASRELKAAEARADSAEERLRQAQAENRVERDRVVAAEDLASFHDARANLQEQRAKLAEELLQWLRETLEKEDQRASRNLDTLESGLSLVA